jgi:transcription elongation GreA/GreB family factor
MSKAFTREDDDDGETELPDRIVSLAPNLVTAEGLKAIEAEFARWTEAHAEASAAADKDAVARAARELRYWSQRRQTAQLTHPPRAADRVAFGSTVTIERADGRRQTWRIVGEDEADPTKGLLSHLAPLARALLGREPGDEVEAGASEAEIVDISI